MSDARSTAETTATRGFVAALLLVVGAAFVGPARAAEKAGPAATDAYAVTAPGKPWVRTTGLEPAGMMSWSMGKPGESQAFLSVDYQGILAPDRTTAYAVLLRRARASIRETLDERTDVERSEFLPDSMLIAGGLSWRGFRVDLSASTMRGSSWRWYALHPDFPRRRTAFLVIYEETSRLRSTAPDRLADARTLARSLRAQGKGLVGGLTDAWLDARALAFAARVDSAQRLCWTTRPEGTLGASHLGYAISSAGDGDFFQISGPPTADSLADPAPAEYGVTFDRNGDGRPDLVVVNRGVHPFVGNAQQPTVAIVADDDFDGLSDGAVVEDVDADNDGRVEARLSVQQRGSTHTFTDAMRHGGLDLGRPVDVSKGTISIGRLGLPGMRTDIAHVFRSTGPHFSELAAALEHCSLR